MSWIRMQGFKGMLFRKTTKMKPVILSITSALDDSIKSITKTTQESRNITAKLIQKGIIGVRNGAVSAVEFNNDLSEAQSLRDLFNLTIKLKSDTNAWNDVKRGGKRAEKVIYGVPKCHVFSIILFEMVGIFDMTPGTDLFPHNLDQGLAGRASIGKLNGITRDNTELLRSYFNNLGPFEFNPPDKFWAYSPASILHRLACECLKLYEWGVKAVKETVDYIDTIELYYTPQWLISHLSFMLATEQLEWGKSCLWSFCQLFPSQSESLDRDKMTIKLSRDSLVAQIAEYYIELARPIDNQGFVRSFDDITEKMLVPVVSIQNQAVHVAIEATNRVIQGFNIVECTSVETDSMDSEAEVTLSRVQDLQDSIEYLEASNAEARTKAEHFQSQAKSMKVQVAALGTEVRQLKERASSTEKELDAKERLILDLGQQLVDARVQLESKTTQNARLQEYADGEKFKRKLETGNLQRVNNTLEKTKPTLESIYNILSSAKVDPKNLAAELQRANSFDKLYSEFTGLKTTIESHGPTVERLISHLDKGQDAGSSAMLLLSKAQENWAKTSHLNTDLITTSNLPAEDQGTIAPPCTPQSTPHITTAASGRDVYDYLIKNMDELARKFAIIYAEIKPCPESEAVELFHTKVAAAANALVEQTGAERSKLRELCLGKRQDLVQFGRDLDRNPDILPDILPPYEPLLQLLDTEVDKFQKVFKDRSDKITIYYDEAAEIAESIGLNPPKKPANFHLDQIEALKASLKALREERDKRFARLEGLLDKVYPLYKELEYNTQTVDLNCDPFKNLRNENLAQLEAEIKYLTELRESRVQESKEINDEIKKLSADISCPIKLTSELSTSYLEELRGARDTMLVLLEQQLADLTSKALENYAAAAMELGFDLKTFETGTREAYQAILTETERLHKITNDRKRISSLYEELLKLKEDEEKLQEASKNPDRYKQRGAVLIDEGKRRNRVLIRKPRVIQQLKNLSAQWSSKYSEPLKFNGKELSSLLGNEEAKGSRKPAARAAAAVTKAVNKIAKNVSTQISRGISRNRTPAPQPRPDTQPRRAAAKAPVAQVTRRSTAQPVPGQSAVQATQAALAAPPNIPTLAQPTHSTANTKSHTAPQLSVAAPRGKLVSDPSPLKPTKGLWSPFKPVRKPLASRTNEKQVMAPVSSGVAKKTPIRKPESIPGLENELSVLGSLPSVGNKTPSRKSQRLFECCDNLKYAPPVRTVKIAPFDPDMSAIDTKNQASPHN